MRIAAIVGLALLPVLAACAGNGLAASDCVQVSRKHLAVPNESGGRTLVCDPIRLNPSYVQQYFPRDPRPAPQNEAPGQG
ncbi:MAG: hypothetical protein ACTS3R_16000 [Inquilinaceae bacterium]